MLKQLLVEIRNSRVRAETKLKRINRIAIFVKSIIALFHLCTLVLLSVMFSIEDMDLAVNVTGLITHILAFLFQTVSNISDIDTLVAERTFALTQYRELDRDLSLNLSRNHLSSEQLEIIYNETVNQLVLIEGTLVR